MALKQPIPSKLYDVALTAGANPLEPFINVDATTAAMHDDALLAHALEYVARSTEGNYDMLVKRIHIAPACEQLRCM